jgi:hypothetical protein
MGGIHEVHVEMGSGAMIHILNFIKVGSDIRKLLRREYTYRQQGDLISLLLIFSK